VKDHKDHEREDKLTEIADEERQKVKDVTAPLGDLLERVRGVIKELEDTEKQIDMEGKANVEKIQSTYDEVYKLLKRQEEEALDKANSIMESCRKRIFAQKENAKYLERELANCEEFRTKIMTTDRARLVLNYSEWIKIRVGKLQREVDRTSFDPECHAMDIALKCPRPVYFIDNLGSEAFDVPYLQNCSFSRYAYVLKSAVPKTSSIGNLLSSQSSVDSTDQIKVTVILRDRFGLPVTDQSDNLEIDCSKDEDFLEDVVITEQSNGKYNLWYSPKINENHSLQIYWKEHLVNCEEIKALITV